MVSRDLHDRCWLHGLGWKMVGAPANCSTPIVDRMVAAGERLVFGGKPGSGRATAARRRLGPRRSLLQLLRLTSLNSAGRDDLSE